jgi:hypothetical protein
VEAHGEPESINWSKFRAEEFTQLSRYAPHEVDTDEKKHECFLNDLMLGWHML